MNNTLENGERLSALADGQLFGVEAQQALDWLEHDKGAQDDWNTYHLLGDVMRSGSAPSLDREAAFMQRLSQALAKESWPLAQTDATKIVADTTMPEDFKALNGVKKSAANDAFIRWRWAGGLASLLAVLVVGWQGLNAGFELGAAPQTAQVIVPTGQSLAALPLVVAREEVPVMIRDPQLDAFLAAHKQFGGTSAFQKPSGFLSNAVFEGAPR
jgi:sigma-E factor negative regulatory protein RseA